MNVKVPSILDLPFNVLRNVCLSMDSGHVHNWKRAVEFLEDYKQRDVMQLSIVEQRGKSPSMALLKDLNSRGWNIVHLAELVKRANIIEVLDILHEYCEDKGLHIQLPTRTVDPPPNSDWTAAKNCLQRSPYPDSILPPVGAMEEASRRYGPRVAHRDHEAVTEGVELVAESASGTLLGRDSSDVPSPTNTDRSATTPTLSVATPTSLISVDYKSLLEATDNFDQLPYKEGGHKLGAGGFGEVFYCKLPLEGGDREVAVKVFIKKESEGERDTCESGASLESVERREFVTEIESLKNLSHESLLPILGYSCDGPSLCLLYPFMVHGSLDQHLSNTDTLSPHTRLSVACDVASALSYLHTASPQVIVHRDVKSANVLLSGSFRGLLGDFGIARVMPMNNSTSVMTTTVVGTNVYMAREYQNGIVSPAGDVYAFGVVLVELLTGLHAQSLIRHTSGEEMDLIEYIEEFEGEEEKLLIGRWPEGVWQQVWSLAEQCRYQNRRKRPNSSNVAAELHQVRDSF